MLPEFAAACSSYHVVLEGSGFGAAAKRGILVSLFQLTWARHKSSCTRTWTRWLRSVDVGERAIAIALLELARAKGLLTVEPA